MRHAAGHRTPRHTVVVGAGLAGLSAALHLRGRGVEVTLVEAADQVGGRSPEVVADGFTLDTGPTVLTETAHVAAAFAAVGENLADHLELRPVDPAYIAHFPDGTCLPMYADPARMRQVIGDFAGPREARGYERFVRHVERLYDVEFPHFIDRNLDGVGSLISPALLRLTALRGFGRLDRLVASFFTDPGCSRRSASRRCMSGCHRTGRAACSRW